MRKDVINPNIYTAYKRLPISLDTSKPNRELFPVVRRGSPLLKSTMLYDSRQGPQIVPDVFVRQAPLDEKGYGGGVLMYVKSPQSRLEEFVRREVQNGVVEERLEHCVLHLDGRLETESAYSLERILQNTAPDKRQETLYMVNASLPQVTIKEDAVTMSVNDKEFFAAFGHDGEVAVHERFLKGLHPEDIDPTGLTWQNDFRLQWEEGSPYFFEATMFEQRIKSGDNDFAGYFIAGVRLPTKDARAVYSDVVRCVQRTGTVDVGSLRSQVDAYVRFDIVPYEHRRP